MKGEDVKKVCEYGALETEAIRNTLLGRWLSESGDAKSLDFPTKFIEREVRSTIHYALKKQDSVLTLKVKELEGQLKKSKETMELMREDYQESMREKVKKDTEIKELTKERDKLQEADNYCKKCTSEEIKARDAEIKRLTDELVIRILKDVNRVKKR